jgi:rod shape determining protein RodA
MSLSATNKMSSLYDKIFKYDLSILIITFFIVVAGFINLYSATQTSTIQGTSVLFKQQLIYMAISIVCMLVFIFIDYHRFERLVIPAYVITIILLVLVLLVGKSSKGSSRWLSLGFINLQPSELMKLCIVWTLAKYFNNDRKVGGYSLKELFIPALMVVIPTGLTIIQPDLGTGIIITVVSFTIFMFVKIKLKSLLILTTVTVIALPIVYVFVLKDYQKKRVITFMDPASDPKGAGYNSLQSRIAVGSGQLFGKGYMKGTQTQLNFLPEHHTDFIFSVLSEEHGFLGTSMIVTVFSLLMFIGVRIAAKARDKLGAILAIGCTAIFFWHAFINIGMVIGIMPVVGVTLPFMSYGGSSMVISFIAIGTLQNIAIRRYMF